MKELIVIGTKEQRGRTFVVKVDEVLYDLLNQFNWYGHITDKRKELRVYTFKCDINTSKLTFKSWFGAPIPSGKLDDGVIRIEQFVLRAGYNIEYTSWHNISVKCINGDTADYTINNIQVLYSTPTRRSNDEINRLKELMITGDEEVTEESQVEDMLNDRHERSYDGYVVFKQLPDGYTTAIIQSKQEIINLFTLENISHNNIDELNQKGSFNYYNAKYNSRLHIFRACINTRLITDLRNVVTYISEKRFGNSYEFEQLKAIVSYLSSFGGECGNEYCR